MRESPANRLERHWPDYAVRPVLPVYERPTWDETARPMEERLKDFMGEHPKVTVAAAAAVGLMLGWMVKRR
jgi:hypothetical protein